MMYTCMLKEFLKGLIYGNFYQLELSSIWVMLLELAGRLHEIISIIVRRELTNYYGQLIANTQGM